MKKDLKPITVNVERIPVNERKENKRTKPLVRLDNFTVLKQNEKKRQTQLINHKSYYEVEQHQGPFIDGYKEFERKTKPKIIQESTEKVPQKFPVHKSVSHAPLVCLVDQMDSKIKGELNYHKRIQISDARNEQFSDEYDFYEEAPLMTVNQFQEMPQKVVDRSQFVKVERGPLIAAVEGNPMPQTMKKNNQ